MGRATEQMVLQVRVVTAERRTQKSEGAASKASVPPHVTVPARSPHVQFCHVRVILHKCARCILHGQSDVHVCGAPDAMLKPPTAVTHEKRNKVRISKSTFVLPQETKPRKTNAKDE